MNNRDIILSLNPRLFNKQGNELKDGKGGVVYIDPHELGFNLANRVQDYQQYASEVSKLVKFKFKKELGANKWFYIYAYDGIGFIPIVNSNMRSSSFTGKNAPYMDALEDIILSPPISKKWNVIIPDYDFGRVEFSCGDGIVDVLGQYPDNIYPVDSPQGHFPSLQYIYKRGGSTYDFALHFATSFKMYLIACLNRPIKVSEWNNFDLLRVVDKLYCAGLKNGTVLVKYM